MVYFIKYYDYRYKSACYDSQDIVDELIADESITATDEAI